MPQNVNRSVVLVDVLVDVLFDVLADVLADVLVECSKLAKIFFSEISFGMLFQI